MSALGSARRPVERAKIGHCRGIFANARKRTSLVDEDMQCRLRGGGLLAASEQIERSIHPKFDRYSYLLNVPTSMLLYKRGVSMWTLPHD